MKPIFTLTSFTPAEAAAITGVSNDLQRDWRRHGYIAKRDGHARFDVFDLAAMLSMKLLADRGIGPKLSFEVAEYCALGITGCALKWVDSWEGDHLSEKLFEHTRAKEWGTVSAFLTRQLWRAQTRPPLQPAGCFIWWADGDHVFRESFDEAISQLSTSDSKTDGAIVVLLFDSIASMLIDRAGRALCHVEIE